MSERALRTVARTSACRPHDGEAHRRPAAFVRRLRARHAHTRRPSGL